MRKTIVIILAIVLSLSTIVYAESPTKPIIIGSEMIKDYPLNDVTGKMVLTGVLLIEMMASLGELPIMATKQFVIYGGSKLVGAVLFTADEAYLAEYSIENDNITSFMWSAKKGQAFLDKLINDFSQDLDYWQMDNLFVMAGLTHLQSMIEEGKIVRRTY